MVAPPLPGHWDPLRVLSTALVARGHRVTFVHMADAAPMLTDTALDFVAVGHGTHGPAALAQYRTVLARAPSRRGFFEMIRATAAISDMLLRDLPGTLARIGAEAVIADDTEAAGGMVAGYLGLPFVTSLTGLPLLRERGVPPPFTRWRYRPGRLGEQRNAGGYWVADRLMRPIAQVLEQHGRMLGVGVKEPGSPLLQVAQCPAGLDFPRRALPAAFHYCGPFRGPLKDSSALPNDGRPLVYCSLGSLQGDRPELFAAMTGACADVGARAVVAHGGLLDAAAAQRLPGDPIVGAFWPQPAVLPQCAAAILHGGFNTVLDALAAGLPMVVAPLAFEQPGTAARVAWVGAGRVLTGRLERAGLRRALERVMADEGYREAAGRLASEMAQLGGAEAAADLIDAALRTGRTPVPPPPSPQLLPLPHA